MSFLASIFDRLDSLKLLGKISEAERIKLKTYYRETYHELDVDGQKIPAWRIRHSNALGPGKGGIRFHPEANEDEVKALSLLMSLKNSLAGLPYGGGKGGVKFDVKNSSPEFLQKVSRAYAKAFADVIGQDVDIPAPDVYTNPQTMAWMLDEYEKTVGHHEPAMITGKPLSLGGLAMRADSTAEGGYIVTEAYLEANTLPKKGLKVIVQGFGNAGSFMAQKLSAAGHSIIAVSDSRGAVQNSAGINIDRLIEIKSSDVDVAGSGLGEAVDPKAMLELEADLLILAALEDQITAENADLIKARHIIELANGPVTSEADKVLFKKGIQVVPDLLANSGGVVGSYFEWAMNRTGDILDEQYLKAKFKSMMLASWQKLHSEFIAGKGGYDMRTAGYIVATRRILDAEKARGAL